MTLSKIAVSATSTIAVNADARMRRVLTRLGYDTQGVDGVIGTNTRAALRRWQIANGRIADGSYKGKDGGTVYTTDVIANVFHKLDLGSRDHAAA